MHIKKKTIICVLVKHHVLSNPRYCYRVLHSLIFTKQIRLSQRPRSGLGMIMNTTRQAIVAPSLATLRNHCLRKRTNISGGGYHPAKSFSR